jgi:hypothetical protein
MVKGHVSSLGSKALGKIMKAWKCFVNKLQLILALHVESIKRVNLWQGSNLRVQSMAPPYFILKNYTQKC